MRRCAAVAQSAAAPWSVVVEVQPTRVSIAQREGWARLRRSIWSNIWASRYSECISALLYISSPKASRQMPFFNHDRQRLFYRTQGSGPLLLLLPGNTASSASHAGELAAFSRAYQVAALDPLGTGRSDRIACWPAMWWEQQAHAEPALSRTSAMTSVLRSARAGVAS